MQDAVSKLALARAQTAECRKALDDMLDALHQSPAWQSWDEQYEAAKLREAEANDAVRKLALECYAESGNKHPHPAVTVKVATVARYDRDIATEWCKEHLPIALKTVLANEKLFEVAAKAAPAAQVPFFSIEQVPSAAVSRDLTEFLPPLPDPENEEIPF